MNELDGRVHDRAISRAQRNPPHGGLLVDLLLAQDEAAVLRKHSTALPAITLNGRQLCDLELLLNGGFSPLKGFMTRADYLSVVERLRLADGTLWPMPVTLDVDAAVANGIHPGQEVVLRDSDATPLAIMRVEDAFRLDGEHEALRVFGTLDTGHPGVAEVLAKAGRICLGGSIRGIQLPAHADFAALRDTPRSLRAWFQANGWHRVVAFQTRNPMHRAHYELTVRAMSQTGAKLLLHPTVGRTRAGDVDHFTRVRCYQALLPYYGGASAKLSLLPLAMRMGGPREALLHAIIRKNYGATHFIVGRDHAGPGESSNGTPYYGPYDAQALVLSHADELGMHILPYKEMVYAANRGAYVATDEIRGGDMAQAISGTEFRRRLAGGEEVPEWFSFPEVVAILRGSFRPRTRPGVVVWLTGLSGAGKSTIAKALAALLMERTNRTVSMLDGDEMRRHLSAGLGFSREDRLANVLRVAYVAGEIAKHGGIAICALISPYADARKQAQSMIEAHGHYLEVHVSTDLAVCESRDVKGLYALARLGQLPHFTGVSSPYEVPENPALRIDASLASATDLAEDVFEVLLGNGVTTCDGWCWSYPDLVDIASI
ncbi:bifunctional sulfate adenylyltransferase/adenylylsulfate kinase [Dyella sp. SG609]|uniref:bifunctional sulfate adenylyltransferase/adenylylsulfate kinase n=1 Tax=Dyella sp. SG609 TaxID=2587018 RepID=UPI0017FD71DE|nr:sulfate adenylyltransferase [Dyella sp. SG609]